MIPACAEGTEAATAAVWYRQRFFAKSLLDKEQSPTDVLVKARRRPSVYHVPEPKTAATGRFGATARATPSSVPAYGSERYGGYASRALTTPARTQSRACAASIRAHSPTSAAAATARDAHAAGFGDDGGAEATTAGATLGLRCLTHTTASKAKAIALCVG